MSSLVTMLPLLLVLVGQACAETTSIDVSVPNWYAVDGGEAAAERMLAQSSQGGKCQATPSASQGPFYTPGVKIKETNISFCAVSEAETAEEPRNLTLTGNVFRAGNCRSKKRQDWMEVDAMIELWQADNNGVYDNRNDNCRTAFMVNKNGRFSVETIIPGSYGGFNCKRPSHLHVKVTAEGYKTLVTQMYFQGDPYLGPNDCGCGQSCNSGAKKLQRKLSCKGGHCSAKFDIFMEMI